MNARMLNSAPVAVALALLFGAGSAVAADEVAASFDRMLTHTPAERAAITGTDRDRDPLLAAMVIPMRDGARQSLAQADPVADSFARMLAHTPNPVAPAVPSALGSDPLIAAVVEPVRTWLAQSGSTTHVARAPAETMEH